MLKKLLVTAATAGALAAGTLVVSAPAQATPPNYPSSVVTVTHGSAVKTRVPRGHHPRIRIKVTSGISQPVKGQLKIRVSGYVKWVRYRGHPITVKLSKHLRRGWHTVRITFVPNAGSVFKRSKDTVAIKIVKHHRHHNR